MMLLIFCASFVYAQAASGGSSNKTSEKENKQTSKAGAPEVVDAPAQSGSAIVVSGRIRIVGSMPFTEMVISDADENDWFVSGYDRAQLENHQGAKVTVQGEASIVDIILADGSRVGVRRQLSRITIIK
ncbi:MAG: hypothetical protein LBG72_04595 [Spirochaetaceae bacterium]|nr:hypothetical protein [Spirochaetaceae bacterium]